MGHLLWSSRRLGWGILTVGIWVLGGAITMTFAVEGRPDDEMLAKLSTNELRFQDFEQAVAVLGLKDAQEKAFREKVKARSEKLEKLDQTEEAKKLAEIRGQLKEAKDEAKAEELKKQMKPLAESYEVKRAALRAEVLESLAPEQQNRWVQWVLFRDLTAKTKWAALNAEQKNLLWKACSEPAGKLVKDHVLKTDPYLRQSVQVREELEAALAKDILTKEQRERQPKPGDKAKK